MFLFLLDRLILWHSFNMSTSGVCSQKPRNFIFILVQIYRKKNFRSGFPKYKKMTIFPKCIYTFHIHLKWLIYIGNLRYESLLTGIHDESRLSDWSSLRNDRSEESMEMNGCPIASKKLICKNLWVLPKNLMGFYSLRYIAYPFILFWKVIG